MAPKLNSTGWIQPTLDKVKELRLCGFVAYVTFSLYTYFISSIHEPWAGHRGKQWRFIAMFIFSKNMKSCPLIPSAFWDVTLNETTCMKVPCIMQGIVGSQQGLGSLIQKSVDHKYKDLFLDSQFCSINLCIYPYVITTQSFVTKAL